MNPATGNAVGVDMNAATAPYRAMAQTGQALTEIGSEFLERRQRAEVFDQLNTFQADTLDEVLKYQQSMNPNTDPDEYEKGMKNLLSNREKYAGMLKNPVARDRATQWFRQYQPQAAHAAYMDAQKLYVNQAKSRLELNLSKLTNAAINAPDAATRQRMLEQAQKTALQAGGLGAEQDGVSLLNSADAEMLWLDTEAKIMQGIAKVDEGKAQQLLESTAMGMASQIGWPKTIEYFSDASNIKALIDEQGMTIADISALTQDIKGFSTVKQAEEDKATKAATVAEMDAINQAVWENTPDGIYRAIKLVQSAQYLDPEKKAANVKELQEVARKMGSGEFEPLYLTGSNEQYNRISREIERDPRPYLDGNKLKEAVFNKEITMSQATLLQGKVDKFAGTEAEKDPLKTDLYRRYSASIDNIIKTFYKDKAVPIATLRIQEMWDKWIQANPDATPDEMQAAFEKVIQPEAVKIVAGKEGYTEDNGGIGRFFRLVSPPVHYYKTYKEGGGFARYAFPPLSMGTSEKKKTGKTPYEQVFGEPLPGNEPEPVIPPINIINPTTGEKLISRDGGKTWQPL